MDPRLGCGEQGGFVSSWGGLGCRLSHGGGETSQKPVEERRVMRRIASVVSLLGALLLASPGASPQTNSQEERNSIVFVFADGRQQSFAVADISRIEFRDSAMIVSRGGRQQRFPVAEIARIEFTSSPG